MLRVGDRVRERSGARRLGTVCELIAPRGRGFPGGKLVELVVDWDWGCTIDAFCAESDVEPLEEENRVGTHDRPLRC